MAEEEGFELREYKGGTRWYALVRYTRTLETWDLQISCVKRGLDRCLIRASFVANVAREVYLRDAAK
jgi:hypothetical protein